MTIEIGIVSQNAAVPGRQEREHDRLGRVGDRGEVVAREDRERLGDRQAFAGFLVARQRAAERETRRARGETRPSGSVGAIAAGRAVRTSSPA